MLCISAAYAIVRHLSVCQSVRQFVCPSRSCILYSQIVSLSGSHTILVFPYQTLSQYSDGDPPPNGDVECKWGMKKSRFSTNVSLYLRNDTKIGSYLL